MRCAACSVENQSGSHFCASCGGALVQNVGGSQEASAGVASPDRASGQPSTYQRAIALLRKAQAERTGLGAAGAVFVVCAALSLVGWIPLGLIPGLIGGVIPEGDCTGLSPGTPFMYVCSVKVALLTVAAPLLVMCVLFVFRKQVTAWVARLVPKLPEEARFLIAPVLATLFFVISWSGAHQATALQTGVLPQTVFPSVIGVFTYGIARFGPALQRVLSSFFDVRDRYSVRIRFAAAVLVPFLISFIITLEDRVSQTAVKEQFIVLISLATGYLAMAPRTGDLLTAVKQMIPDRPREA